MWIPILERRITMIKKLKERSVGHLFLVHFLLLFMLLIFGPAEIFFANASEFEFVYGEFAVLLALLALGIAVILTVLEAFLPEKWRNILISLIFGLSLAGYIQVMFCNRDLDMLGVNPDGYKIKASTALISSALWILCIGAVFFLLLRNKKTWKKVTGYGAAFLLIIQTVALCSLLLTADKSAYTRPAEGWRLSGEDQYVVSADKNVIVVILDYFSSITRDQLLEVYPGATDCLHDFTYYNNMDSVYYGTYPCLPLMLTGHELDMELTVNEWCASIWNDENTIQFYEDLHNNNYVANLYTPDTNVLCGTNSVELLKDKFSNLVSTSEEVDIYYKKLLKTMVKMSAYRMCPELLKPAFYTQFAEYEGIVTAVEHPIIHNNYDFYDGLLTKGLSVDDKANYLIVQHLMGTHDFSTDGAGHFDADGNSVAETAKGCFVILEEYFNQLKELGVYDDATIIVTADHGSFDQAQVIFYLKKPGETHEKSPANSAPASHRNFLPTLAACTGLDAAAYGEGKTVFDFEPGEQVERTFWLRRPSKDYPTVPCYTGNRTGDSNVYYGFTYTGDYQDSLRISWDKPDFCIPMKDAFF